MSDMQDLRAEHRAGGVDWKWLSTTLLALAILSATLWAVHQEALRAAAAADSADRRMARIETAVHVDQLTGLVSLSDGQHEALTVSQNPAASSADLIASIKGYLDQGDKPKAIAAAEGATNMILSARELKTPAPPGYFTNALVALNSLAPISDANLVSEIFATRVALAEYNSALEIAPEFPQKTARGL